jgi:competence protein ComEA
LALRVILSWTAVMVVLLALIITGTILTLSRYNHASEIQISLQGDQDRESFIYVTGNVSMPGLYAFSTTDTIGELLKAAGSPSIDDGAEIRLNITPAETRYDAQKIDINRADVWLLHALPGIGKTLAQRIVYYRDQNGLFKNIEELKKVAGIGDDSFEELKNMVTVSDR